MRMYGLADVFSVGAHLYGEAQLADHIADGEDVRDVGTQLRVDVDVAAIGYRDAGFFGGDFLAVGRAAHGLQYHVVALRFGGRRLAFELDPDAVRFRFRGNGFGLE